jgi:hypothetical protein
MSLPKLNASPKYSIKIPSDGRQVRYRPFLVREEKILLLALESKNEQAMLDAVVDTIQACVEEDIDKNKLTTFDIEYMFVKIRSKSVGETTKLGLKCTECELANDIEINVDELTIDVPNIEKIIVLDENISLEMCWPSYKRITKDVGQDLSSSDQMFTIVKASLEAVITADERINLAEVPDAELETFIDSMSSEQFKKIRDFIEQMPSLKHKVEFNCVSCKHHNETTVEGMQNFF